MVAPLGKVEASSPELFRHFNVLGVLGRKEGAEGRFGVCGLRSGGCGDDGGRRSRTVPSSEVDWGLLSERGRGFAGLSPRENRLFDIGWDGKAKSMDAWDSRRR